MKLEVKKMGINGEGIAYYRHKPVFIKDVLKDEIVEVKIIKDEKTYYIAEAIKIYKYSKDRVEVSCPYYKRCGACQIMHMNYKSQLEYKKENLKEALYKYADIDDELIEGVIINDSPLAYRNSLKLNITLKDDKLVSGLYESGSNRFIYVKDCLIHNKALERIKKNILNVLNKYRYKEVYGLYLRILDDKVQAVIVTDKIKLSDECIEDLSKIENLSSLYQSIRKKRSENFFGNFIHLAKDKRLRFNFMNLKLELSNNSFFQLNTKQAIKLYEIVKSLVPSKNEVIFEAYSGIGVMSLLVSSKANKVIGCDIVKDAIDNANRNAKLNDIKNVEFIAGDSAEVIRRYTKKEKIDTLIVDPPRSGLDEKMLECIEKSKIKNIIYVSCNPATLAKNLAVLKRKYKINRIIPLDMFSNSAHVETVVLMTRKEK